MPSCCAAARVDADSSRDRVTRQDCAFLSQLLLVKCYGASGLIHRSASLDVIGERLRWLSLLDRVQLVDGGLSRDWHADSP